MAKRNGIPQPITVDSGDNWSITFSRSMGDFTAWVDGHAIGFANTQSQARELIRAHIHAALTK